MADGALPQIVIPEGAAAPVRDLTAVDSRLSALLRPGSTTRTPTFASSPSAAG